MCRFAWQAPDFTKGVFIIIQDPGCMACRHPIHTFHSPTSHSRSSNKRLRFHDMDFPWQHLLRYLSPILHPAFPVTVPNGTFLPWRIRIFLISSTKKSLPKGKSWQTPCGVRGYGTVLSSGGIIDADRFKNLRKSKRNQSGWNKNVSRRHTAKQYSIHGVSWCTGKLGPPDQEFNKTKRCEEAITKGKGDQILWKKDNVWQIQTSRKLTMESAESEYLPT